MTAPEVDQFIDALRAEPKVPADHVDVIEAELRDIDRRADMDRDVLQMWNAIAWVLRQRSKSLIEKLEALIKLDSIPGKIHILSLRKFLGW